MAQTDRSMSSFHPTPRLPGTHHGTDGVKHLLGLDGVGVVVLLDEDRLLVANLHDADGVLKLRLGQF